MLKRTRDLFSWKHWENPFGRSIILVATSSDRIVGLRAFMRWRLEAKAGVIECARPVDTATHPDFQRRGIFRDLTMNAIDAAEAAGIQLLFNTPNDRSRPGYLKMGWSEVGRIPVQARIRPGRWLSTELRDRVELSDGQPKLDTDALQPKARSGLHTPQSREYRKWRYLDHPTVEYLAFTDSNNTAVTRVDRRKGRVGIAISDVYGERPAAAIRKVRREMQASYLVSSFPPHSKERMAALRSGLIPIPGLYALTLVARPLADLGFDVTSLDNWQLSLSDLELL